MSELTERARAAVSDYELAKVHRVAVAPSRAYGLLSKLVEEVERLEAAVDRVRATHWPSSTRTAACDCYDGLTDCPTIAALNGKA